MDVGDLMTLWGEFCFFRVPQGPHWGGGCLLRICSWVYMVCPNLVFEILCLSWDGMVQSLIDLFFGLQYL